MKRRKALLLIAGTAALPLLPRLAAGQGADTAREPDAGAVDPPASPTQLQLRLPAGETAISSVCLNSAEGLVRLEVAAGLRERGEDPVDPDARPYFGAFRHAPYGPEDFTERNRVGRAYVDGATMFAYLASDFVLTTGVVRFVLLNDRSSWLFEDAYHPVAMETVTELMPRFMWTAPVRRVLQAGLIGARQPSRWDRMMLAGEVPAAEVATLRGPVRADLRRLDRLAVGEVYRREKEGPEITVLVRPSIVLGGS